MDENTQVTRDIAFTGDKLLFSSKRWDFYRIEHYRDHCWHYQVQKHVYENIFFLMAYVCVDSICYIRNSTDESAVTAYQCYRKLCSGQCGHDYVWNETSLIFTGHFAVYTVYSLQDLYIYIHSLSIMQYNTILIGQIP